MSSIIDNFFLASNTISNIADQDYNDVHKWVEALEAFSRITYQSIYIIDYFKRDFLYVSENPLFLCGRSPEEVRQMGYMFYISHVPEDELKMLMQINKAGFNFYSRIPKEERGLYTISYDFHIQQDRKKTLINHKLTPMVLTDDGRIWLAVCAVSLSGHTSPGHVEMRKTGVQQDAWFYNLKSNEWERIPPVFLNDKEKSILLLSAQGFSTKDIADRIFLSVNTVKFHKKSIFEKLHVSNITEALSLATNYRLL